MAEMIGRTKSWLAWLAGAVLAMVFGGAGCGPSDPPVVKYGAPSAPPTAPTPPAVQPAPAKPTTDLEGSADWQVITDAWNFAMPFARSGQSTTAQRKEMGAKLTAAREAAGRLVKAGLLSAKEAELLTSEADKAVADIRREPPVGVECYLTSDIPAVQRLSFKSIAARLPAIEDLVKAGKVHRVAITKVLEAIEADLVTLADEKRRAELGDLTSKEEADKLRETIKAQLDKLKQQLADGQKP